MRYRNDYGEVFDEDDLEDKVREAFTYDDFNNWVDDNYSGLSIPPGIEISPSEALEAMGDYDDAYEKAVYRIIEDWGGLYPDLSDLGIYEIDDDEDSESVRSAMSSAYGKTKTAAKNVGSKAKQTGARVRSKVKTGNAPARAKARASRSKASSASRKGVRR